MEELKEALIIQGLELQGQVHLLAKVLANTSNNKKTNVEKLYREAKARLNNIKNVLRKGLPKKDINKPLRISEFEGRDLSLVNKSKSEDKLKAIHYRINTAYLSLKDAVDSLHSAGINAVNLYVCLQVFASQMLLIIKQSEQMLDRQAQVEDIIKEINEKKDKEDKED